jgi:hypothetical protein
VTIRPYRPSDRPALLAIHQRQSEHDGLGYVFADPDDPQQFAAIVAEEDGRVVAGAMGRKISEGYTLLDPAWGGNGSRGPVKRWMLLSRLISESARVAYDAGYTELMAATPPHWRGYTDRLVRELGFVVDARNRLYLDLHSRFAVRPVAAGRG